MINLKLFSTELRAKINSDITALELLLQRKNDPEAFNAKMEVNLGVIKFSFTTPPIDYFEKREIEKCFKSVVGSTQDYLDQLIALKKTLNEFPHGVIRPKAVGDYLNQFFNQNLHKISTDSKTNTSQKLTLLIDKSNEKHQMVFESLQSLFYIRNGLEHHKGIAKLQRQLKFKRIAFISSSGKEIQFPGLLDQGEGLQFTLIDEIVHYDKGRNITITKELLYLVIQSLLMHSISILGKTLSTDIQNFRKYVSSFDNTKSLSP